MDKLLCFEKTTTENPEPIRSNPKLRAEPVLQAWQEWKTRTLPPAFTAPPTAGCTNLHLLAQKNLSPLHSAAHSRPSRSAASTAPMLSGPKKMKTASLPISSNPDPKKE